MRRRVRAILWDRVTEEHKKMACRELAALGPSPSVEKLERVLANAELVVSLLRRGRLVLLPTSPLTILPFCLAKRRGCTRMRLLGGFYRRSSASLLLVLL